MTARRTAESAELGIAVPSSGTDGGRVEPLLSAPMHFGRAAGVTACQPLARPAALAAPPERYLQPGSLSIHPSRPWMADEYTADRYGDAVPAPHRQPRYRAIAEEIRRRITAGAIPAGALIPSESALTAEFRVARGTIREAISVLRADGMVMTEHGRGTYASPQMPLRRLGPDRYRLSPNFDEGTGGERASVTLTDHAEQVDAEHKEVPATPELAALFGLDPGTLLLECRLRVSTNGIPQQATTSYCILQMIIEALAADAKQEPATGAHIAQLHSAGISIATVQETVRVRPPATIERVLLRMPVGVPVFEVRRYARSKERLVEYASTLFRGDLNELVYSLVGPDG
jgi:GntR family transcriptional regulator